MEQKILDYKNYLLQSSESIKDYLIYKEKSSKSIESIIENISKSNSVLELENCAATLDSYMDTLKDYNSWVDLKDHKDVKRQVKIIKITS